MKGISISWIKEEYLTMIVCLHKFLTCEGRYAVTFLYHLRLLLNSKGGPQIELPHFIWMSLNKMVRGVKSASKKPETSLYHHGMMKLLVVHELRKIDSSCKKLLTEKISQEFSKSIEVNISREHSKELGRKKGYSKKKRNKYSSKVDHVDPISPKFVIKLDKGNMVVLSPQLALVV
jgi:hypothetical protein